MSQAEPLSIRPAHLSDDSAQPNASTGSLRILFLCEGDAETNDSWSGISKSVVSELRAAGHTVLPRDVDLYGLAKLWALLVTWSPRRFRWWVRYHLMPTPFRLRSKRAASHIRECRDDIDIILQVGATFEAEGRGQIPCAIYCDSNARLAERGTAYGHSEVSALTERELAGVIERERGVYAGSSLIMTLSERLRSSFIEDFDIPADRVRAIFAGSNFLESDIPATRPTPADSAPTVLFVGRRFHRKGGDLLLRAFEKVRESIPNSRLIIVGPPDLDVAQEGVQNLGFLNRDTPDDAFRLRKAFEDSHVFCMPTRFEAFGLVYLEAMLFGLPCIGPDAWAVPEIVVDGETGVIVPPEDVEALARAMIHLLRNPELGERMGEAGRKRVLQWFTWASVIKRMEDGFRFALARG
jgi:alpha-maltose-1-phosphate synthase